MHYNSQIPFLISGLNLSITNKITSTHIDASELVETPTGELIDVRAERHFTVKDDAEVTHC